MHSDKLRQLSIWKKSEILAYLLVARQFAVLFLKRQKTIQKLNTKDSEILLNFVYGHLVLRTRNEGVG